MKIKFLIPVQGFAYFENDIAEIADAAGAMLVSKGYAVIIPETEGPVNNLPIDMPYRQLLFNAGFETVEDILLSRNALADYGLKKPAIEKIINFITCNP